jgi:ornithine cyclodeaminase/alanine dehydrogenase-like protein (mu-crystallin family)
MASRRGMRDSGEKVAMSDQSPLWISEADVVSMMSLGDAINALERGLGAEARGDAQNMVKTHVTWGQGSTLHAIGAVFAKDGFVGTKTWAHTEGGATPLLVLFDSGDGSLKAVIEAFALGQMRTGAASGVATRWLAAEGAGELAIIGAGKQAATQVAAVVAVRPIRRVRVFGRNEERRAKFVARVTDEFGIEVVATSNVSEAVAGAPIITVVTRSTEPILFADMVGRGAHINAVGAITPERAEIARDVLERCGHVVVDTIPSAQKLSRELIEYFGAEASGWEPVKSLASVVAAGRPRAASDDLTLFKSMGMGISDLALGIELYHEATRRGLGRGFAHPQKVAPRLR